MDAFEFVQSIFDANHYLANNSDVEQSGLEPWFHFVTFGIESGRDPSPYFDTSYYLAQNPDVVASGMDAFTHFLEHGLFEGRVPSPLFDADYYLSQNPDVAASDLTPYYHFIVFGQEEGRLPMESAPLDAEAPSSGATDNLDKPLLLLGTDQADQLVGGAANDVLVGAGGNDVLNGGDGQDIFGFALGFGQDVIQDFNVTEDILRMQSLDIGSYADLQVAAVVETTGDDTLISFDDGSSLTLIGVADPSTIEFMPLPLA
ncbi:hypothetical protein [Labrenzia sp. PHM005]|uniref:hypothetical protein n=1 Tax=Labrenzia sp. PHM005 TaxID=2590016 RepID=UPI00114030FD|nr:hypothetical protein [Labrenzia sp. PHM005]QDG76698.1 hypothetical protein FJ695_12910 [Labrenzia sp. PHM005]